MWTSYECWKLAQQYQDQANKQGVSPRVATALKNMSESFEALANQYDVLFDIIAQEDREPLH